MNKPEHIIQSGYVEEDGAFLVTVHSPEFKEEICSFAILNLNNPPRLVPLTDCWKNVRHLYISKN